MPRAAASQRFGRCGAGFDAYLTREQRAHAARTAVEAADGVPVIIGVGALRPSHALELAEDAQKAGTSGVLLAPMTYQPLIEDQVFGLYENVTRDLKGLSAGRLTG